MLRRARGYRWHARRRASDVPGDDRENPRSRTQLQGDARSSASAQLHVSERCLTTVQDSVDAADRTSCRLETDVSARRGYHLIVPANVRDLPSLVIERVETRKGAVAGATNLLLDERAKLAELETEGGAYRGVQAVEQNHPAAPRPCSAVRAVVVCDG
ncbi:hypothetical protein PybrP1_003104 [[Pythium] brassicae (nom. inval.)]|nr:hypothetical protein PybrP1_003104 [[Pythium] brassicae (nom. inval.)]